MPTLEAAPRTNPLEALYAFVRAHLLIFNNVVLASATLVAALDFLAPRLALAPVIVYSMTTGLTLLMVLAAVAPAFAGRMLAAVGAGPRGSLPLWRRPAWQVSLVFLLAVSIIGFASVAKAAEGGLIASHSPAARGFQESLLGLRRDMAEVKRGVDAANGKLDILVGDSRDPQRDLVGHGYSYDDSGLFKALRLGDKRAVALFVQSGYRANQIYAIGWVLHGEQPWDAELVALLPPSMFMSKSACEQGSSLLSALKPPVEQRIAAFRRLCDPAPWVALLRETIKQDQLTPSPNDWWERMRAARKLNLALLTR